MIGPGRSGTTWIYHVLSLHPDVGVSSSKETLFFQDYYHKGFDWYERFFSHCRGRRAVGEVSNTYVFSPTAAENIHRFNPGMKIISSLRNPVDRAFSHYLLLRQNGQVTDSFESVIARQPDLVERGFYWRHLQPYLALFPRQQVLILIFEELRSDPFGVARRLYEFVGVDPSFRDEAIAQVVFGASRPRSRRVARIAKWSGEVLRRLGYPELITRAKRSLLPKLLYAPYTKSQYPRISQASRRRLEEYYRADVEKLSTLIEVDLRTIWF